MCVILVTGNEKRPTDLQVAKCFQRNSEGAGIAWIETAADGTKEVVWKKDLNREEILEAVQTVPLPFIAHFRIASIGGVRPELTHPFEVGPEANNDLEGRTKLAALFHNGTWGRWEDMVLTSAVKFGYQIPRRKWNDSRGLAWLGWMYGPGLWEILVEQKIAVLTPEGTEIYGVGWKNIDGILASNDLWIHEYVPGFSQPYTPPMRHIPQGQGNTGNTGTFSASDTRGVCAFGNCKNSAIYRKRFCFEHKDFEQGDDSVKVTHLTAKGDTQAASANERSPFEQRLHRMVRTRPDLVYMVAEKAYQSQDGRLSKNAWKRVQKAVDEARYIEATIAAAEKKSPILLN